MVDAVELLNAAKRLLLAAIVGDTPRNESTGTTIIPPPRPIIEPTTPATNPSGISHRVSNIFVIPSNQVLNFVLIFSRTGFLEEILKRQWDCL
jgi:hypothetical protein